MVVRMYWYISAVRLRMHSASEGIMFRVFFHKVLEFWGRLAFEDDFRSPSGTKSDGGTDVRDRVR